MMREKSKISKVVDAVMALAQDRVGHALDDVVVGLVVGLEDDLRAGEHLGIEVGHGLERHGDVVEPVEPHHLAHELARARLPDDAAAQRADLDGVADRLAVVPQRQRRLVADHAQLLMAPVLLVAEEAPVADLELVGVEPVTVAGEDARAIHVAVVGEDVLVAEAHPHRVALEMRHRREERVAIVEGDAARVARRLALLALGRLGEDADEARAAEILNVVQQRRRARSAPATT